jgi:hypothetical protein
MFSSYINAIKCATTEKNNIKLRAILKLNKILISTLRVEQIGGSDGEKTEDEKKLIGMIAPLKQKIIDIQNTNLKINDLIESKEQLRDLIEFIHYIHAKLPDDKNVKLLSDQMNEINRIVNKY